MKEEKPTTQAEILDAEGISHDNGICSATTNTFVRNLLKNNYVFHLAGDRKALYKKIRREELRQHQLQRDGEDADHSGFVKTETPYEIKAVNTHAIASGEDLLTILGSSSHSMIKFPIGRSSHQIYFGHMNFGQCRLFDPNLRGGVKKGACDTLADEEAEKIQKYSGGKGMTLIAKTKMSNR